MLGSLFITDADLVAVDVKNGGKYVVTHTEPGVNGNQALQRAADLAARHSGRLFGLFGRSGLDHLPFQTADGRYDPAPSIGSRGDLRRPSGTRPPTASNNPRWPR